ncbi:helix-turn-helix domain-containing protein [Eggerthella sp. YY7918]|uniref:helix-turn-helix domain-containing protein n=1 Tax=Eggerthella sp. (strain YY7918) TaxID=502558 RepID=UPI0002171299|nr:predicted transcriptional regulator [Eggerthella sp. YY7918]
MLGAMAIPQTDNSSHSALCSALGAAVKSKRAARGFTAQEFSLASGLSRSHLRAIEAGKGNPTLETIEKIALALGEDPLEFLSDLSYS